MAIRGGCVRGCGRISGRRPEGLATAGLTDPNSGGWRQETDRIRASSTVASSELLLANIFRKLVPDDRPSEGSAG
jgi:hypothetical protein